jgi:Tfp pilus assembly protein PilO
MNAFAKKWDTMTVKTKWLVIILSLALVYVLSYQLNIKKTREEISKYKAISEEFNNLRDITVLKENNTTPEDSVLSIENLSVLNSISSYCEEHSLNIHEISQTNNNESDLFTIETTKLVLNGSYENILQFIYYLEKERKLARVNSVTFHLAKYKNSKNHSLIATIYIKYIRNENI